MKQQTGILQSMKILAKIKDGYSSFNKLLEDYDKKYRLVLQYIIGCENKFDESDMDRKLAFIAAFGEKATYNTQRINILFKQLSEWIDKFAMMKNLEGSGHKEIAEAEIYGQKGDFEKMEKSLEAACEMTKSRDEVLQRYIKSEVLHIRYFYSEGDKRSAEYQKVLDEFIRESYAFHFGRIFEAYIEKLTLYRVQDEEIPKELASILQHQFTILLPNISIFVDLQVLVIKFLLNPSFQTYKVLKSAILKDLGKLVSGKMSFFAALSNALVIMPHPVDNVMKEYLSIYEIGIDSETFLEGYDMECEMFDNIVLAARTFKKFDLIQRFIETHKHLIKDLEKRESCVGMAKCYLSYGDGKFFTAFQELISVNPIYPVFTIRKYLFGFIAYFDNAKDKQKAYVYMKQKEGSFRKLLSNYERKGYIPAIQRRGCLNFLIIFSRISNVKYKNTSSDVLTRLLASFEGRITEIIWIEEKIASWK